MLRLADSFCKAGTTPEENAVRIQRYDVLLAISDGTAARAAGRIPFGYLMADPENSWHAWIRNYGYKKYLDDRNLDGLEIDCPFDYSTPITLCEHIAKEIAPKILIPNFGDWITWQGKNPTNKAAAQALHQMCDWHFVQVAHKMTLHTDKSWADLKHAANIRLAAGKKLVLGIYDKDGLCELTAALLTLAMEHPSLYWHYNTSTEHPMQLEHQWNMFWRYAR